MTSIIKYSQSSHRGHCHLNRPNSYKFRKRVSTMEYYECWPGKSTTNPASADCANIAITIAAWPCPSSKLGHMVWPSQNPVMRASASPSRALETIHSSFKIALPKWPERNAFLLAHYNGQRINLRNLNASGG